MISLLLNLFCVFVVASSTVSANETSRDENNSIQEEIKILHDIVGKLTKKVESCSKTVDTLNKKVELSVNELNQKVGSGEKTVNALGKKVDSSVKTVSELYTKVDSFSEYCRLLPEGSCGPCTCKDDTRLLNKHYCDCQNLTPKRDCKQFHQEGFTINGIYKIHQNNLKIIQVFCDQQTDDGGWTVFQRRIDGSVKFYRDWQSYKVGFGELQNEFWMGNSNLFTMSLQGLFPSGNELRIELEDWTGVKKYAKYSSFQVGSELTKYQINLGGYGGDAGDGISYHNGQKFSTFDNDNDSNPGNCAIYYLGGWWYNSCVIANLNGKYYDYKKLGPASTGVCWRPFHGQNYSFKVVEMKMRRKA